MTTHNAAAKPSESLTSFEMPDPERGPEDMTSFDHLSANGNAYLLTKHLGNSETTLVAGERFLSPQLTGDLTGLRVPDLLIAFNVNPEAYRRSNAYIIAEQGKPPDFVMEIASRSTGRTDVLEKRDDYAALGIPEYWRFDETGRFHRTLLAGDRLADGAYQPIAIEEFPDGSLQGFSEVLNLHIRWEQGQLRWHDPATGRHIATFDDERARADNAEARVSELEEELRRLRST